MSKYAFGVDVGGTTVKLGLFNDEGQVLDKWEIPTVKDNGGEKVLPDIAASIKNKMQEKSITAADLVGVGIGAPGAVNAEGFMVNGAVNIGWGSFDLAETLKKELDLPVTVKAGNDANVAALGEMWQGGGKGYSNLVAVTLGTGVGGGIIIDGRILTGTNVPAVRSDIFISKTTRQRSAAVRTRAVWSSMHPLPELPVWPTDVWPKTMLPACSEVVKSLRRPYLMR